jgi:hypothetical protein
MLESSEILSWRQFLVCQAPKATNSSKLQSTQIVNYCVLYGATKSNKTIDAFNALECFVGVKTASRKGMAIKICQVHTRLTTRGLSHNFFLVESFLRVRYCRRGETTVALLNLLLTGANAKLLSDSVKSARRDLNNKTSSLLTGEYSQRVEVSHSLIVETDPHGMKIV